MSGKTAFCDLPSFPLHFMRHSVHRLKFSGITSVRVLGEIFKTVNLGWKGYKIVRFIDDIILKCTYR